MRVRVPVAVRNRLVRLEGVKSVNLPIGGWPPIMDLDEWEALASGMQDQLSTSAQEELRPLVEQPAVVPPTLRKADDGLRERSKRSAIQQYLEAQQKAREGASNPVAARDSTLHP